MAKKPYIISTFSGKKGELPSARLVGSGGEGGGGESGTLLGNTPLKLASASSVMLRTNSSATYSVKSDTKAVFNPASGTTENAMVSQENGEYVLKAGDGATDWYQSYVDAAVGGLTVGEVYNFVFDANGVTTDDSTHQTVGHYILYDSDGGTLVTRGAADGARKNVYAFTATTESVKLRWYPATNSTFVSGTSTARTKRIYINAADTSDYSAVVDLAGSFSGETMLRSLPAGVTIEATPSCAVYAIAEESEAAKPLLGKTVVVFGDSLIGMVRDNTSATAEIAERTGATVYNVGFGGCRMSDHPSHGYAEFSMWALAKAIADNDWTAQETYVSQGSDYFPEQLAVLKGIDFSEVDYVVIHYGTNDFGGGVVIGESSAATDHSTLCGALRYSIETLLGSYPKLRIFISLPCFRFWTVDGQTVFSDTYQNAQNKTLPAYVEAMRSVAREYKLPVIGNYFGNGIDKVNATTYLSDGTHHTTLGRERFGSYIAEQLASGGGGGGSVTPASIVTATGQMTDEQAAATAQNIGIAPLRLIATPTAGPSGTELMSGTWSGATWEEVVAAIQASRLIQIDVATVGKITLLYNLGSATDASSNACAYYVNGILYNVFVKLSTSDGHGQFSLSIINVRTETVNISGTTPVIVPIPNTIYKCGELTSLDIINPPATGTYSVIFTSGATATTTTIPATILGLEDFAAEANTLYEINVLDNRAVVGKWAVSA